MNRTVEANIKLTGTDATGGAFKSAAARMELLEAKAKKFDRIQAQADKASAVNHRVRAIEHQASAFERAQAGVLGYGRDAVRSLGPIAAGFAAVDIVRTSAEFETSLAEIAKKGDLSADALERVKAEILGIVESGKVAMEPGEIAAAYERGIASGIPLADMKEFVLLSAQAADAWDMTGEATGNAFAGFQQSLKIAKEELRPFADLINTLADAGISDERDIVDFLDRAGASLKQLGLQNETIAALGGTMLDLKIPAEQAATSMNAFSTRLLTPDATKASAAAFTKLYGSVDAFKDLLKKDASGAVRDLLSRLKGLNQFDRAGLLTDIVGLEHSSKINRIIDSLDLLEQRIALANDPSRYVGSLSASYQKKLDTMEAKWKVFMANLTKLKIDLGDFILEPGSDFLDDATDAVREFGRVLSGLETTWGVLSAGFEKLTGTETSTIADPWGVAAQGQADERARTSIKDLLDKNPKDPAAGAFAARDMDGAWQGNALASVNNRISQIAGETHGEGVRRDYQTTQVRGYRSAEAESMQAMKEQFGTYLAPDGQSFRPDTDALELIDEAMGEFRDVSLMAASAIEAALPSSATGGDLGRSTGAIATPTFRSTIDDAAPGHVQGADIDGGDGSVSIDGNAGADRLREAMAAGGQDIRQAGADAGAQISTELQQALTLVAGAIGAAFSQEGQALVSGLRAALAAGVKVNMPTGAVPLRRPNADLGQTMPTAGTPGG